MSEFDNLPHPAPEIGFWAPEPVRRLVEAAQAQGERIDASAMMGEELQAFIAAHSATLVGDRT